MTISMADRLASWESSLERCLKESAKWRAEGNFQLEANHVQGSLRNFMFIALVKGKSSEEGAYYLTDPVCREQLLRYHQLERIRWADVKAGKPVGTPWIGSREIFLAWLIGEFGVADDWIVEIRDPVYMWFQCPKTKAGRYWCEFDRSLECLARKTPFEPHFDEKLESLLKYYVAYPRLISAITNKRDLTSALEEVNKGFQVGLKDKRYDGPLEYGNPICPVNWDLRLASIMRAKDHYYGKDSTT